MRKRLAVVAVLSVVCLAGTALALDHWGGPPPGTWQRGEPGTTWEHWEFSQDVVFEPETFDNPWGIPWAELDPPTGWQWGEWECPPEVNPGGMTTGWHCNDPAGGSITLTIPNTDDPNGAKYIFLQVTSTKVASDVNVAGQGGNPGGYTSGSWSTGLPHVPWPGPAPFGGSWYTYNYGRKITPNPASETITLTFPFCTVVDQIVVDTICTQEPIANEGSSWGRVKVLFR